MGRNRGVALCLMGALCAAAQAVTIDWVTVGDAGNAPDDTTYGAVDHSYRIGKYEITNAQYCEFLSAKAALGNPYGLYNTRMMEDPGGISRSGSGTEGDPYVYSANSGWENRAVNYVNLWDAARFANWLHNGQGNGDTETGAYTNMGDQFNFARQPGARFFIPTQGEWYKAAYYDPNKQGGAGYWDYPTKSDTAPRAEYAPGTDLDNGSAPYRILGWYAYRPQEVGRYTAMPSSGPYGTFDQAGNVAEWTESLVGGGEEDWRALRGGSYNAGENFLRASWYDPQYPNTEDAWYGFRLAGSLESAAVPEPATVSLLGIGAVALLRRRRRRA